MHNTPMSARAGGGTAMDGSRYSYSPPSIYPQHHSTRNSITTAKWSLAVHPGIVCAGSAL